jgi:hypothetical protein
MKKPIEAVHDVQLTTVRAGYTVTIPEQERHVVPLTLPLI